MSALSEALGNAAPGHRISHRGQTYQVSLVDQKVKVAFERRLFERHKETLLGLKEAYTPQEYRDRLAELQEAYTLGELGLLSPAGVRFLKSVTGIQLLLSLLVGASEDQILQLVMEKPDEVRGLIGTILAESFPGVSAGVTAPATPPVTGEQDPNAPAPATASP